MYKKLLKILGLISCLIAIVTTWLFDFASQYLPCMPPKIWLSLILLIFLLLIFFKNSPKKESKTIVKFGLKWDNKKNAYCQKCDAILTNFMSPKTNSLMPNPYFKCHKCEHKNYLIDESGKILTFEEAKKLL